MKWNSNYAIGLSNLFLAERYRSIKYCMLHDGSGWKEATDSFSASWFCARGLGSHFFPLLWAWRLQCALHLGVTSLRKGQTKRACETHKWKNWFFLGRLTKRFQKAAIREGYEAFVSPVHFGMLPVHKLNPRLRLGLHAHCVITLCTNWVGVLVALFVYCHHIHIVQFVFVYAATA